MMAKEYALLQRSSLLGSMVRILLTFCLVLLSLGVLLLDGQSVISSAPWFYLAAVVIVNAALYSTKDHAQAFFSPSGLMCNYVGISFFLGSLAFSLHWILDFPGYESYYSFRHLQMSSFYFLLCILVTWLAFLATRRWRLKVRYTQGYSNAKRNVSTVLATIVLVIFAEIDFTIPFWGQGDFSILLCIAAALILSYYAHFSPKKSRFALYAILFMYFIAFQPENKRMALFYLVTVSFLEMYRFKKYSLNVKALVGGLGILVLGVLAVITMSIFRGYGSFDIDNMGDAVLHVPKYLQSDQSATWLVHNLEGPATYLHSTQAVDYMIEKGEYGYGSTFAKALFVPIPRSFFPFKPDSFVEVYNSLFYPEFRRIGGSYVPNLFAEAFWNFGLWGGVFSMFVLFLLLNVSFNTLLFWLRKGQNLRLVKYLGAYYFLVYLLRGSGLDGYLALVIILIVFIALLYTLSDLILETGVLGNKRPRQPLTTAEDVRSD